ncbi:ABC transporter substrate-binding protein [Micromonospora sp. SH-82]|uniref:ABC transporter substrate-binding protein n=1 Tax=Micromonospora sp. SH-82 TaxID=3132938 RepID=UPI003EC09B02
MTSTVARRRDRRPVRRTAGLLAGLLTLAVAGCGSAEGAATAAADADGVRTIRIASSPLSHLSALYVGEQQGIFAKHRIALEWDTTNADLLSVPSVLAGKVDIATGDLTTLVAAKAQGLDVKAIVPASASTGERGEGKDYGALVVRADSGLDRPSQLAGRTVSTNSLTNIAAAAAREAVRADGGDESTVKLLEVPFPDAPAALAAGRVDGAWLVEPFLTLAKSQGAKEIGWGFSDLAEDLTVSAYFTSGSFAQQNPELVRDFRTAVRESFAHARANEDAVREIIPTFTTIKPELAARITITGWKDEVSAPALDRLADYALRDKVITTKPDLSDLVLP